MALMVETSTGEDADEVFDFDDWLTEHNLKHIKELFTEYNMCTEETLNCNNKNFGSLITDYRLYNKTQLIQSIISAMQSLQNKKKLIPQNNLEENLKEKMLLVSHEEMNIIHQIRQYANEMDTLYEEYQNINTNYQNKKSNIQKQIEKYKQQCNEKLSKTRSEIQASFAAIKQIIDNKANELIDTITKLHEDKLNQIQTENTKQVNEITEKLIMCQNLIHNDKLYYDDQISKCENVVKNNSDIQNINDIVKRKENMRLICKNVTDIYKQRTLLINENMNISETLINNNIQFNVDHESQIYSVHVNQSVYDEILNRINSFMTIKRKMEPKQSNSIKNNVASTKEEKRNTNILDEYKNNFVEEKKQQKSRRRSSGWFGFGKKKKGKRATGGFACTIKPWENIFACTTKAIIFPMIYNGPTYKFKSFPDELLFIPYRDAEIHVNPSELFSGSKLNHKYGVSALLIHGNPKNNPTHFMILFHGNGVDLGMASAIWRPLIRALPIHLLIVEYPGYGIMDGRTTCNEVIRVAECIYQFVTSPYELGGLNVSADKVMILGRSIGAGPASYIAKYKCHSLILVSPFTSINKLSKDLLSKWSKWCLLPSYENKSDDNNETSTFVFNNVALISAWKCKHFMVFHGKNDELIPYVHTNTLVDIVKKQKPNLKAIKFLIDGVGHNDVNIQFVGLRIFMQYQDEFLCNKQAETCMINIEDIVSYLNNPPQFDVITNKVVNDRNSSYRSDKYKRNEAKDEDSKHNDKPKAKLINEWDKHKREFNDYRWNLTTKVYDLSVEKDKIAAQALILTHWI
eukprot:404518_1